MQIFKFFYLPGELARRLLWELIQARNNHVHCTLPSTVDDENGMEYGDESNPSSPTSSKTLPRSASGTTVSSQGTQGGKSKKPFFKKVLTLLYNDYYGYSWISKIQTVLYSMRVTLLGSLYFSRKVPTYPSLKLTLTLTSHLGQNVGLGEG